MEETIILTLAGLVVLVAVLVVITFPIHLGLWIKKRNRARRNPTRQSPNSSLVITHFVIAFTIVLLAAIVIPNFVKNPSRPQRLQPEAKTNLGAIYVSQLSYFSDHNTYAGGSDAFKIINWEPAGQNRYAYYCGEDMIENKLPSGGAIIPSPGSTWFYPIRPASSASGFTCMAVGNIDADDDPDVWSINDAKILVNDQNDVR